MIKTPPAHSYSRISTYRSCPRMYKFQCLDKIIPPPSDPLLLGAALHDFFEAYGKHCVRSKTESDIAAVPNLQKDVLAKQKDPLKDHLVDKFNELSQKFADAEILDGATLYGIEQDIAFSSDWKVTEWLAKNAAFRMRMDRFYVNENEATVRDYKTGYGEGDKFQMRCYAVGSFLLLPEVDACWAEFFYVGSGYVARMKFLREDMPAFIEEIEEKCARISEDKKFKPTPGTACQYCPYINRCSAKPSDLLVITSQDDAHKIASDLFLLEGQIKAKKTALKGYVKTHGDVETETGTWGYSHSESFKVDDVDTIISALKKRRINPNEYLTVSATDIKTLSRKDAAFLEEIQNALTVKVTEIFKAMKPKKETIE